MTNYKIKTNIDPTVYMDIDSYAPFYKSNIVLSVLMDAQHDGHLWPKEMVDQEERILVDDIMDKLRPVVESLVQKAKPFAIHGPT